MIWSNINYNALKICKSCKRCRMEIIGSRNEMPINIFFYLKYFCDIMIMYSLNIDTFILWHDDQRWSHVFIYIYTCTYHDISCDMMTRGGLVYIDIHVHLSSARRWSPHHVYNRATIKPQEFSSKRLASSWHLSLYEASLSPWIKPTLNTHHVCIPAYCNTSSLYIPQLHKISNAEISRHCETHICRIETNAHRPIDTVKLVFKGHFNML